MYDITTPLSIFYPSRCQAGRGGWLFLTDEPAITPSPPFLPLVFVYSYFPPSRRVLGLCRGQVFFSYDADRIYFERRQRRQRAAEKEPAKQNVKLTLSAKKIAPSFIFFMPSAQTRRRRHAADQRQRRTRTATNTQPISASGGPATPAERDPTRRDVYRVPY